MVWIQIQILMEELGSGANRESISIELAPPTLWYHSWKALAALSKLLSGRRQL